jgi:hypothetical protein
MKPVEVVALDESIDVVKIAVIGFETGVPLR